MPGVIMKASPDRPAAIVLGLGVTGLGVVRCLHAAGIEIYGITFAAVNNPGRFSRLCHVINKYGGLSEPEKLVEWLLTFLQDIGGRPVVFPTSDALALFVAEHHDRLHDFARITENTWKSLETIICKDRLYATASKAGIMPPPFLNSPTLTNARSWCDSNPPPYLLKPAFQDVGTNILGEKNRFFASRHELFDFLDTTDAKSLLLARVLKGGDGFIFDAYGYCNKNGKVMTLASHRRLRQQAIDFGSTCYGEIPAYPAGNGTENLFLKTLKLLELIPYHGIFGIEWLLERTTGEMFLLDFNARPFTTIGHLNDSGLNLPHLAYLELCDRDIDGFPDRPDLKHIFWVDFNRDLSTFNERNKAGELSMLAWLASLFRSRSFACWRMTDPGPAMYQLLSLFKRMINRLCSF